MVHGGKINVALVIVAVAVLLGTWVPKGLDAYIQSTLPKPPIEAFIRTDILTRQPLKAGVEQELSVRVTRIKTRDCPITSLRWVVALDDGGATYDVRDTVAQSGGPVDADYVDMSYQLPALPAGTYAMHVHLIYACGDQDYHYDQPPAVFSVKETDK